jgi:O-antigen/teichoic acid export membrane protein
LIPLLFSDRFSASSEVMRILCWALPLGCATTTYSVLLTAIDRQREKVVAIGACVGVNLVCNLLLIPPLGYNGTALARVIAEGLQLALMGFLVARYFGRIPFLQVALRPVLACCGMYGVIVHFTELNVAIVVVLGGFTYVSILGLIGGLTRGEIQAVRRILERAKMGKGKRASEERRDGSGGRRNDRGA